MSNRQVKLHVFSVIGNEKRYIRKGAAFGFSKKRKQAKKFEVADAALAQNHLEGLHIVSGIEIVK